MAAPLLQRYAMLGAALPCAEWDLHTRRPPPPPRRWRVLCRGAGDEGSTYRVFEELKQKQAKKEAFPKARNPYQAEGAARSAAAADAKTEERWQAWARRDPAAAEAARKAAEQRQKVARRQSSWEGSPDPLRATVQERQARLINPSKLRRQRQAANARAAAAQPVPLWEKLQAEAEEERRQKAAGVEARQRERLLRRRRQARRARRTAAAGGSGGVTVTVGPRAPPPSVTQQKEAELLGKQWRPNRSTVRQEKAQHAQQQERTELQRLRSAQAAIVAASAATAAPSATAQGNGRATQSLKSQGEVRTKVKEEIETQLLQLRETLLEALNLELAAEIELCETRAREWSLDALVRHGFALSDLSGTFFEKVVLEFSNHKNPQRVMFANGDLVKITVRIPREVASVLQRPDLGVTFDGTVAERTRGGVLVEVEHSVSDAVLTWQNIAPQATWRLDLTANTVTHDRMVTAVKNVTDPDLLFFDSPQGLGLERMRAILVRLDNAAARAAMFCDTVWKPYTEADLHKIAAAGSKLNPTQLAAVQYALTNTFTLWQGPPGTGKTHTLAAFIETAVAQRRGKKQVLATANTNIAVDNIVEGLVARNISVVRVGRAVKIRKELQAYCMDSLVDETAAGEEAKNLRERALKLRAEKTQIDIAASQQYRSWRDFPKQIKGELKALTKQADKLLAEANKLQQGAIQQVLDSVDVVCATCTGAGDAALTGRSFSICVIDEASQATEPSTLIPLARIGVCSAVLIGDPNQLPPTIKSRAAESMGLGKTLFEQLMQAGVEPKLLATQYRMHPAIACFPAYTFYNGKLEDGISADDRIAAQVTGFPWPQAQSPVAFIDCADSRERAGNDKSWMNEKEAEVVRRVVKLLGEGSETADGTYRSLGPASRSVNVVTPYTSQSIHLRSMLPEDCEVNTVDGYQGREADFVIISTVRTTKLGFTDDPRRINVALTRARHGLVVVGHGPTLRKGKWWGQWHAWAASNGLVMRPEQLVNLERPAGAVSLTGESEAGPEVAPPVAHGAVLDAATDVGESHAAPQQAAVDEATAEASVLSGTSSDSMLIALEELKEMKLVELKATAKAWGLKGYSRLNKQGLVEMLTEAPRLKQLAGW